MYLEPFEGPYLKLERAGYHLADLRETITSYQARAVPEFIKTERETDPWEIAISEPPPVVVSLQVSDIAHSLRSALDVMMCDIAIIRNAGLSDMTFPFSGDANAFAERLAAPTKASPFKKLGQDVVDLIEAAQPYKGGNRLLRGLHDLNNADKHRMVVPVVSFASVTANQSAALSKKYGAPIIVLGGSLVAFSVGEPIFDCLFADHPSDCLSFNESTMRLMFPNDFVLTGHILETMEELVNSTFDLVQSFDALVRGAP